MQFEVKIVFLILVFLGLIVTASSMNATIEALAGIPSANVSDYVRNITFSTWNSINTTSLLKNLSKDTLQQLSNYTQGTIPGRVMREINRLLLTNLTNSDIKSKLEKKQISTGDLQQLRRALPPPESFTLGNVTFLGSSILKLGNGFLLRITNISAIKEINKIALQASTTASDPLLIEKYHLFITHLNQKIYGLPETWTNVTFRHMDLSVITADMARRISPSVMVSREQAIIQSVAGPSDFQLKRIILKKILEGEGFYSNETNATEAFSIIDSLANLQNYLLPEDIRNPSFMNNSDIKAIIVDNVKNIASNEKLTPKSASILQKDFATKGSMTADDLSNLGIQLISYASPRILKMVSLNGAFGASDVPQIANGLLPGLGKKNKLQTLANVVSLDRDRNTPTVQQYPTQVIAQLPISTLLKLSETEAKGVLSRNENDSLMDVAPFLVNKIQSGFSDLNVKSRALLSNARVKLLDQFEVAEVANGLPPYSYVSMVAAETAFSGKLNLDGDAISKSLSSVPFIGAREALMVNGSDIIKVLQQMKDINPSMQACCVLKNKFYNYTRDSMGSKSENETLSKLTVGDVENMPLCVLACFGARLFDFVGEDQKVAILERLGLMPNPGWSIPKVFSRRAIKSGLAAMRNGTGIKAGDIEVIGNAVVDIPGEMLGNASADAVPDIINKLEEVIEERQFKPCFDSKQRNAIGMLVKIFKGNDTSEWTTVDDVACLLSCVPPADLVKIPSEVLATASCELPGTIPIVNETMMILCKYSIGASDYGNMTLAEERLKDIQKKAAIDMALDALKGSSRRRSAAICEKLVYSGANGFNESELRNMSYSTIKSCLSDFGSKDMNQSKAEILAKKIQEGIYYAYSYFNASFYLDMGFILKGFSPMDYLNFSTFSYGTGYDDVVAFMGSKNIFSTEQVKTLASKVKAQWKNPLNMTAVDVQTVGYLLCGFNSSDIGLISQEAFKGAIGIISKLDGCPLDPVLTSFVVTAKKIYGSPASWNKSDLAELGVLVSALPPEDLIKLDRTAMEGVTPSAMLIMTQDSITALNPEQFLYLNPATAFSVSDQLKVNLTAGVKSALKTSVVMFYDIKDDDHGMKNMAFFSLVIAMCILVFYVN